MYPTSLMRQANNLPLLNDRFFAQVVSMEHPES
jgi:hypothetical protein